ncbi:uncharacterized protein N7496_008336 [Penicillium cataractarum]|uniref:DUF1993 domain-containing protein n=1 Tax=Penicillium cataractarum TaxID=2100454 RepID=A0A9W9V6Y8_9EURO|nr:uncharacterized protein N7496_008336 [Penicillium cataractarum]KAJ5368576.1 hypothetical protein N7496_008336 [Penicillium cataractarum]
MAHTFYDGTIPVLQSLLRTLTHVLQKGSTPTNTTTSPSELETTIFAARLTPDMYPLSDQIRLATQFAENLAARLTARDPVKFDGSPTTFAQSYERINTVLKALDAADKELVNAQADVLSPTQVGPGAVVDMSGSAYAHRIVLPNVYFHVTTAYGILRMSGVQIGKRDYYEGFFPQ